MEQLKRKLLQIRVLLKKAQLVLKRKVLLLRKILLQIKGEINKLRVQVSLNTWAHLFFQEDNQQTCCIFDIWCRGKE